MQRVSPVAIFLVTLLMLSLGAGGTLAQEQTIEPFGTSPAPLTPAIRVGNTIYVSGQVPLDAEFNLVGDDIASQTEQVLRNIEQVLALAGASLDDVVKTLVILTDIQRDFAGMNEVYAEFFSEPYPARSTLGGDLVVESWLVEIEVIAILD